MADSQIRITAETSQAQAAIKGLTDRLNAVEGTANKAEKGLAGLQRTAGLATAALTALTAGVGIREIVDYTARWTDLNSRLRNATGSSEAADAALRAISNSAKTTYSDLEQTAEVFLRNSMALNELGYTTNEQIRISEALNNAMAVSGARGDQAASALDAFSKAVARGKFEGEDLNRILENADGLAQALATGLGVTTGELRRMVTDGLLTTERAVEALGSQFDDLARRATEMPATVADGFIVLNNSIFEFVGRMDSALGISSAVSGVLVTLSENVEVVVGGLAGIGVAVLALTAKMVGLATVTAIATGGLTLIAAAGVGAALAYAAKQAGLFADEAEKALDPLEQQRQAAENAAAAEQRRADAAKRVVEEQNRGLKGLFDKLRLEQESVGQGILEVSIKRNLAEAARTLKVEEDKISASVRQRIIDETTALEIKRVQNALNVESLQAAQEALTYAIQDKDLREQQLAVDQARARFGDLLTQEMEKQIRATVAQKQANQETLAITNARIAAERALNGELSRAEAIQRGVGVRQRLDPTGAADADYKMDMEALKSHLDSKLISEQQYQRSVIALKKEYTDRANQLYIQDAENQKRQRQTAIQAEQMRLGKTAEEARAYSEFEMKTTAEKTQFGIQKSAEMFSALGAQNKKAFEAAKAFNIANAIMNTYLSVTKSLAMYPFPFNLIAAGAALAMGMAQVAQIRSQNYSGRQLGGPVMGGQSYLVGEAGPEIFTPNTTGSITRNQDIGRGGEVTVNFTINAVDTAGFDELLTERRGVIQSIIRDAMLEKGQRF